jgi:hypothetical protein
VVFNAYFGPEPIKQITMSANTILNESWSDYDDKKKKGVDSRFFSCEEQWERDYLKRKIKRLFPSLNEISIEAAIGSCCTEISAPRPRKQFVECVMRKLGL